jgi:hypothetical protein
MLGLIVLAAALWWGMRLVRACGVRLSPEERWVVGTVAGLVVGFWLIYLISASADGLSTAVLVASISAFGLTGYLMGLRPRTTAAPPARWFVVFAGGMAVVLLVMNWYGVLAHDHAGNVLAIEHTWADAPFHSSIITSFAYRSFVPPTYPVALGQPLGYPFLIDFISGVLLRAGWSLRMAFVVPNVLVQLAFFCATALITLRLTGSRRAAVLAAVVFMCLGNFGFAAIGKDVHAAGGMGKWLGSLPWSYTGDALGDPGRKRLGTGLYLGNPTFMYLIPRRSGTLGVTTGVALFLLLEEFLEHPRAGTAVLMGLIVGLLPRVHGQTLLTVAIVVAVSLALLPLRTGSRGVRPFVRAWGNAVPAAALMGVVALAVAVPQLAVISRQAKGFFQWFPGWTGEPHETIGAIASTSGLARTAAVGRAVTATVRFWILNAGALLLIVVPALRRGGRALRLWYVPFAAVWAFANAIRTQPWEWDNVNYFVYVQLATTVLAASYLAPLLRGWRIREPSPDTAARAARLAGGVLLAAALTFGGLLSFVYAGEHRMFLWSADGVRFAAHVRARTPEDAVVLTSDGHEHPVYALSGRQGFMGFVGWLSTQGLDWARFQSELRGMYSGDVALMRRLGIDYVVVGAWERGLASSQKFTLANVFDDPSVFRPVLSEDVDGQQWKLLRLLPEAGG